MLTFALKSLVGRARSLVMTLIAIALAVAFVSGVLVFTGSLESTFANAARGRLADITVAAKGALDPDKLDVPAKTYGQADIDKVKAIDGVKNVVGYGQAPVAFAKKNGKPAASGPMPTMAYAWTELSMSTDKPAQRILSGHAPGAGELVMSESIFKSSGYQLGDRLKLTIASADALTEKEFTVVGTAKWNGGMAPGELVFLDGGQFRELAGLPTQLWVETDGAPSQATADAINAALPGSEALTSTQAAELSGTAAGSNMGFLRPLLLFFAAIAVVVAMFLIINTFSIVVLQRTRELALVRAIGATPGQVRISVLVEGLICGVVGSLLGLGLGWLLALGLASALGGSAESLELTPVAIISGLAVGIVVTTVASVVPALRAGSVPPVVAMSQQSTGARGAIQRQDPSNPPYTKAISAHLANLNAWRRPGRTIATAMTLTLGLILVGAVGVLGASMKGTVAEMFPKAMTADFVVMAGRSFPASTIDEIRGVSGVGATHVVEGAGATIADEQTNILAYASPDDFGSPIAQEILDGRAPQAANELAVVEAVMTQRGWSVGQDIAGSVQGVDVTWRIVGRFKYPENVDMGGFTTSTATLRAAQLPPQPAFVGVDLRDGADAGTTKEGLQTIVDKTPGSGLLDVVEFNKVAGQQVDMMMLGVNALIALSTIIALLGIVNTLALSVVERRRELGLLRAVGMTGGQITRMITVESLIISVGGGALGIALGVALGILIQRSSNGQLSVLAIPWLQIAAVLAIIVVLGVVAAIWPARRASRAPILSAIAA